MNISNSASDTAIHVRNSSRKRFVAGSWLGALMPAMLSSYELGNLIILQRTFLAEFVTQRQVRRNYCDSNQAILVSAQISLVHAMAEGARMTLILSDMSHETEETFDFLVPIISGVLWNVAVPRLSRSDGSATRNQWGWWLMVRRWLPWLPMASNVQ